MTLIIAWNNNFISQISTLLTILHVKMLRRYGVSSTIFIKRRFWFWFWWFQGIGKRRVKSQNRDSQQDLLTWIPMKEEFNKAGPLLSTYGHQFRGVPVEVDGLKQKLVSRTRLTVDRPGLTTYRTSHGHDNPHRRSPSPVLKNRLLKPEPNKATVATCLNWYRPPRPLPFIGNPGCPTKRLLDPIAPSQDQCRTSDNDVQIPGCQQIHLPECRPVTSAEKTSCHLAARKEYLGTDDGGRGKEAAVAVAAAKDAEEHRGETRPQSSDQGGCGCWTTILFLSSWLEFFWSVVLFQDLLKRNKTFSVVLLRSCWLCNQSSEESQKKTRKPHSLIIGFSSFSHRPLKRGFEITLAFFRPP